MAALTRPKHSGQSKASAERVVKDIRRATRRHISAEYKIRIVLESLRGDDSIAELCRKEGKRRAASSTSTYMMIRKISVCLGVKSRFLGKSTS